VKVAVGEAVAVGAGMDVEVAVGDAVSMGVIVGGDVIVDVEVTNWVLVGDTSSPTVSPPLQATANTRGMQRMRTRRRLFTITPLKMRCINSAGCPLALPIQQHPIANRQLSTASKPMMVHRRWTDFP